MSENLKFSFPTSAVYVRNIYVANIIRKNETTLNKRDRIVAASNKLQKKSFYFDK